MNLIPTLAALRCFVTSARLGSFTRAAQQLHLTQGAVSHQVIGLESLVGVPLFRRAKSGLALTPAGEGYCAEISAALRQIERATQQLVTHQGQGGQLNVSVASSFANHWLMPRLSDFVTRHPSITLHLSTKIGPVNFLLDGCDAALEYCAGTAPGLHATKVLDLALRPYIAPAQLKGVRLGTQKVLLGLLNRFPLIRHSTVPEAWPEWLGYAGLTSKMVSMHLTDGPQYDLLAMAGAGAAAGVGIALLPDYLAESAVAAGKLACLSNVTWSSAQAYYLRYPVHHAGFQALAHFERWLIGWDR